MLYPTIKHELQTVSSEIHKIQQQLLAFPSGHLSCLHNGKYIKWIQSEKSKQSIISKKIGHSLSNCGQKLSIISSFRFNSRGKIPDKLFITL